MISFELEKLPADELKAYDRMMVETALRVIRLSRLALQLWSAVLKELSNRELVSLISGSFDEIATARIQRHYDPE